MTDWAAGIETRNYGIKRNVDKGMFSELVRSTLSLTLVAGALVFCSWVRQQIINIGYESQSLFTEEESLLRAQKRLRLEEETLKNPERIDVIARNELGMLPLRPAQMVLPEPRDAEPSLSDVLAMIYFEGTALKKAASGKRSGDYSN
jgi:cell division protein FtsL